MFTRRSFLRRSPVLFVPSILATAQKKERPPALPLELVKEFVGAAHGDLEKTTRLLEETPSLLNATYDWSNGDFEKAIGGAGHMGRADVAEFLIARGAQFDIFVAAMLGRLEIVRSMVSAYPAIVHSKGPHGISLIRHAEKGGEQAKETLEFIRSHTL